MMGTVYYPHSLNSQIIGAHNFAYQIEYIRSLSFHCSFVFGRFRLSSGSATVYSLHTIYNFLFKYLIHLGRVVSGEGVRRRWKCSCRIFKFMVRIIIKNYMTFFNSGFQSLSYYNRNVVDVMIMIKTMMMIINQWRCMLKHCLTNKMHTYR